MNKITVTLAAAGLTVLALTGCSQSTPTGQAQENAQQQQDTRTLINNQPIPHYSYSQIRQTLIDAESIAANGTQTTSFFFQLGAQNPVFSCPSIGMPVANTAQLSNPQQVVPDPNSSAGSLTIGQMDPYGIYAPAASQGTYVICVNGAGQKYLQYWEGDVMTVAAQAEWDGAAHQIKVTGAPTATIHTAP